ncbi:leucine-rich repeat-containing protein 45 isoform X1 [Lingula anatina]|uniref:Leucine-rich repeat-containing protein 45 isoform X1 n=1 Tax=Lingula anatina TaxID=7574 RepID=A0A1S3INX5_LINAN|nr:leucine-rich repeat-containing protein 45 isoform X1 [Lingula anatina]XP_013399238.1 leucine-rich repeat-containing protein 45 isoform X1 [Lingula anatina]XP_013399240.1 leucine-rich repeat-containing protein 45 isoform X1 [Lingula anatina]XP_013399241.1 leucine-rich repeat-containing protein 45 isoform X1 [Lingula anatina]|eukprot:XP_013399235.1 leucine-rich repeat-containing protein 45 isoform X1 [Lingula anatina]
MDEFKSAYLRLCREYNVEPHDALMKQLKIIPTSPRKGKQSLKLSSVSLSPKTCTVLGKVLATDHTFTEIKLADCMLNEDAVKSLAYGLAENVVCKRLDLKGNNVRGTGTEALARMLRHNKSLTSLCLEWNAMGMIDNSFGTFCEALAVNTTLKELDLRNNQISHDGAQELASALKRNTTLQAIDLRWNNVGIIGGRALLEALRRNKTIYKLSLAGNNIPTDVLQSIDTALGHNEDRQLMSNDYYQRTHMLSSELRTLKEEKMMQMSELMGKIDEQEDFMRKTTRSSSHKIGQLQSALEERKAAFESLKAKLSMVESELALEQQKSHDLEGLVARMKQDQSELSSRHQSDLRQEREDRASVESRLLRELSEANDRNVQLEAKEDELSRKCKQQQDQIYDLKEQLTHAQADIKLKGAQYEEKFNNEKQKNKEILQEMESLKTREIAKLQQDFDDTEKQLRERINKLERQRLELEEEVSKLKSQAAADRIKAEEELATVKHKIRSDEEQRQKQLEDRMRILQQSKDELQSHSNHQQALISELQGKNSSMVLELETHKRRIDAQNTELSGKNNEMMAEVGKVKLEVKQKMAQLETERQAQNELKEEIGRLKRQISEQTGKHRELIHDKEREIESLQEKVREKDKELIRMREEDAQRSSMLQSAIMTYVARSPHK